MVIQEDLREAKYIISRLIGDVARDTYISRCRTVNTGFKFEVAYGRYASTIVNLCKVT
jgi:hypothetical protein